MTRITSRRLLLLAPEYSNHQLPLFLAARGAAVVVADGVSAVQVVLMYFMMQTSGGDRPPTWKTVAIQCVASGAAVLGAFTYKQQMSSRPLHGCRLLVYGP